MKYIKNVLDRIINARKKRRPGDTFTDARGRTYTILRDGSYKRHGVNRALYRAFKNGRHEKVADLIQLTAVRGW